MSRNWSHVEQVPGPDNRLAEQVPLSATAGVDYKTGALSTGAAGSQSTHSTQPGKTWVRAMLEARF